MSQRSSRSEPSKAKTGVTYATVTLEDPVDIPQTTDLAKIKVLTPTVTARVTRNVPPLNEETTTPDDDRLLQISNDPSGTLTTVFLDAVYRQLHRNEPVLVTRDVVPQGRAKSVTSQVRESMVSLEALEVPADEIRLPVTLLELSPVLDATWFGEPAELTFHFAFVDGGRVTRVADTEPSDTDLRSSEGVPLVGLPEVPPSASGGVLTQKFLLRDADNKGALVTGTLTFNPNGTARFKVTGDEELPSTFKTPITVFGNILETTRGESVFDEVPPSGVKNIRASYRLRQRQRQRERQRELRQQPLVPARPHRGAE